MYKIKTETFQFDPCVEKDPSVDIGEFAFNVRCVDFYFFFLFFCYFFGCITENVTFKNNLYLYTRLIKFDSKFYQYPRLTSLTN